MNLLGITALLMASSALPSGSWVKVLESKLPPQVKSAEACAAVGGEWGNRGESVVPFCKIPTHDAEKACVEHSDCESLCIDPNNSRAGTEVKGKCAPSFYLGCFTPVQGGRTEPSACAE